MVAKWADVSLKIPLDLLDFFLYEHSKQTKIMRDVMGEEKHHENKRQSGRSRFLGWVRVRKDGEKVGERH